MNAWAQLWAKGKHSIAPQLGNVRVLESEGGPAAVVAQILLLDAWVQKQMPGIAGRVAALVATRKAQGRVSMDVYTKSRDIGSEVIKQLKEEKSSAEVQLMLGCCRVMQQSLHGKMQGERVC